MISEHGLCPSVVACVEDVVISQYLEGSTLQEKDVHNLALHKPLAELYDYFFQMFVSPNSCAG